MKIRPLGNKLLLRRREGAAMMGRFHVPENAKETPSEGEVLSVGNGCVDVHTGDVVLFGKYAGTEVRDGEGSLALMLTEDDVLAVVMER